MDKIIAIILLFTILSCGKNKSSSNNEGGGEESAQTSRENATEIDPWESAGTPIIPEDITVTDRIRSLIFEDGLLMSYNGDTAGDGNGIGATDDEEICRQHEVDDENLEVCLDLSSLNITCNIDGSTEPDCDDVYAELGNDFECEADTLGGDPTLKCSDDWGIIANGERGRSKTLCRVLLSDNTGYCLNAYKEEDDGTGTLVPVLSEDLILNMQEVSWKGYDGGHLANPAQAFDDAPPINPLPLENLPENAVLTYRTLDTSLCTVDNDLDETNGIKGTLTPVNGSAPTVCTVILTIESPQYADRIFIMEFELVEENDSTWTGYAGTLAAAPFGGTFYAREKISPDAIGGTLSGPELSYTSVDESICTVDEDSGEVTGIAHGICIINLLISQNGYLDKRLPAIIPVTPLRQYQGILWTGFPDDDSIAVGQTTGSLSAPLPIPNAVGIDEHTVEWKSGDCTWAGGTTRTITPYNTRPCVLSVVIKKRGYADFSKDFTFMPALGLQSGFSWSPAQSSGTVGTDLVMDAFGATLSNNERLQYIVSDAGDTGCAFSGLSGDDIRTLSFRDEGTCAVQAVVSRSGYEDWNSSEISISVSKGNISVTSWGNYENFVINTTTEAPELGDITPSNVEKSYASSDENQCTVDAITGLVNSVRTGTNNCSIELTLSHPGYNDNTHTYTFSVLIDNVDLQWEGYNADSINFADIATPPTLIAPISNTPGASFQYTSTDMTICTVDPATGALTLLTAGECTITVTAAATHYRSIKKNVVITIAQEPQSIALADGDAANVYGASPTLTVGSTLIVDAGATLPSGGAGPLTYESSDEDVCTTVADGTVTGAGVGACTITLYFAGDTNTLPTNALTVLEIEVGKGPQAFNIWTNPYGASPRLKAGGDPLNIKNTPPEDNGYGDLEYSSLDETICEVNATSGTITPVDGGKDCVVQARYTGNDNYEASNVVDLITISIRKFNQPRELVAPTAPYGTSPALIVGEGTLTIVNAPAADGLTPVGYRPLNGDESFCTVDATSGEVTPISAGSCVVEAHYSESNRYHPTSYVTIATIPVTAGTRATDPTWTPASSGTVAIPLVLDAVSGTEDTDTIIYRVVSGDCSFDSGSEENERTLNFAAAGTCTVQATVEKTGYPDWNSASHDITVAPGSQTLVAPTDPYGDSPTLNAGDSDLTIVTEPDTGQGATQYRSTTTDECTVNETSGSISPLAAGECIIEARYAGDSNYNPSNYVEIFRITIGP